MAMGDLVGYHVQKNGWLFLSESSIPNKYINEIEEVKLKPLGLIKRLRVMLNKKHLEGSLGVIFLIKGGVGKLKYNLDNPFKKNIYIVYPRCPDAINAGYY